MKIVSIINLSLYNHQYLTIGKVYNVIEEKLDVNLYRIKDDSGVYSLYHMSYFDTLENCRNEKIEMIYEK